jgi:hypothetical protein
LLSHALKHVARRVTDLSALDNDVVIDTCVLAHSCNATVPFHSSALDLLEALGHNEHVVWVLDDLGGTAPQAHTSLLYAEYHETLAPQSFPLVLLASFLRFGRVSFSARPNRPQREAIRRLIPRNNRDRVVFAAAVNSRGRVLVTNDYTDFSQDVRDEARSQFDVRVLDSSEL